MSALGQKQTCALQLAMSALPPKADMCGAARDVRFGPKADISPMVLQVLTLIYFLGGSSSPVDVSFATKFPREMS
jgi:hypothetical protein